MHLAHRWLSPNIRKWYGNCFVTQKLVCPSWTQRGARQLGARLGSLIERRPRQWGKSAHPFLQAIGNWISYRFSHSRSCSSDYDQTFSFSSCDICNLRDCEQRLVATMSSRIQVIGNILGLGSEFEDWFFVSFYIGCEVKCEENRREVQSVLIKEKQKRTEYLVRSKKIDGPKSSLGCKCRLQSCPSISCLFFLLTSWLFLSLFVSKEADSSLASSQIFALLVFACRQNFL